MKLFEKRLHDRRSRMPRRVRVEFEVPEDLFDPSVTDADLSTQAKQDLVLRLFREKKLSSGGAAQILGVTRRDFLDLLARRGLPFFDLDPTELEDELDAGRRIAEAS
jgi:predicted HTH domain antitoxin